MVNSEGVAKAVIAAAAGTFLGWAGSALTLSGRVDAIERTLSRIESRIDSAVIDRAPATATTAKSHEPAHPETR